FSELRRMTARSWERATFPKAGPLFFSVTSPQPSMPQRIYAIDPFKCMAKALKLQAAPDPQFQATKFGQSPQPADGGISGIGLLFEVVQHLVSMIGAHGQTMVRTPCGDALLLFLDQSLYHGEHIHIPIQVLGFMEIPLDIPSGAAKVDEIDAVPQAFHHAGKIVFRDHPIGARTETKAVVFTVHGSE